MTYFKITDSNKREYYLKHESGKYSDGLGNEYVMLNSKLINVDAILNAIEVSSFESISPVVYAENVNNELKRDTVILLIKPIAECDSETFSNIVSMIYSLNLKIDNYMEHIFTTEEVDTLYFDIRERLENSGEYSGVKSYLTSGISRVLVVKGKNARAILRSKIGDRDSKKAEAGTMRAIAGWSETCNGVEIVDDNTNKLSVIESIINNHNEVSKPYTKR